MYARVHSGQAAGQGTNTQGGFLAGAGRNQRGQEEQAGPISAQPGAKLGPQGAAQKDPRPAQEGGCNDHRGGGCRKQRSIVTYVHVCLMNQLKKSKTTIERKKNRENRYASLGGT